VLAAGGLAQIRASAYWWLGLASLLYFLLVGDPLLPAYTYAEAVAVGDVAAHEALRGVLVTLGLWLAPGLALPFLVRRGLELRKVLLALAIASGVATSVHQFRADYSTHYMYGERGQARATAYLAERANPHRLTLAPKDLAFRVLPCGSYVYSNRSLSSGLAARLLADGQLDLFVLRRGDLADARAQRTLAEPNVRRILATEFEQRRIGDFLFYEKRGAR
jgi:hypothetical protein